MAKTYLDSLLGETEVITLVARQHWFLLVRAILLEIVLVLIIFVIVTVLAFWSPFAWIGLVLAFLPLAKGSYDFIVWSNRQYVVTSRRVIQISGVMNKNVTDSSLEKVNDVKLVQSFFGRLFDYGDVEILTASELGANLFQQIGNPIRFKTAMLNAKERLGRDEIGPAGEAAPGNRDIPALIAELDSLRQQGVLTEQEFEQKKSQLLAKL
jgi:uncharacterized membrane protein YdbT with pleckstrin-like domain